MSLVSVYRSNDGTEWSFIPNSTLESSTPEQFAVLVCDVDGVPMKLIMQYDDDLDAVNYDLKDPVELQAAVRRIVNAAIPKAFRSGAEHKQLNQSEDWSDEWNSSDC